MNQDIKAKRRRAAKECALNRGGNKEQKRSLYHCNYCQKDISSTPRIKCAVCPDFDLCLECFSVGVEIVPHKNNHDYRVIDDLSFPIFHPQWGADEEMLLLEAIDQYGLGNWTAVAEHVGPICNAAQCKEHYFAVYIDVPTCPLPTALPEMALYEQQKAKEARLKAEAKAAAAEAAAQAALVNPPVAAGPADQQQVEAAQQMDVDVPAPTTAAAPAAAAGPAADGSTVPDGVQASLAARAAAPALVVPPPAQVSGAPATHASSPPSRKRKLTGAAAAAAARAQARREAEAAAAAAAAAEAAAAEAAAAAEVDGTVPTGLTLEPPTQPPAQSGDAAGLAGDGQQQPVGHDAQAATAVEAQAAGRAAIGQEAPDGAAVGQIAADQAMPAVAAVEGGGAATEATRATAAAHASSLLDSASKASTKPEVDGGAGDGPKATGAAAAAQATSNESVKVEGVAAAAQAASNESVKVEGVTAAEPEDASRITVEVAQLQAAEQAAMDLDVKPEVGVEAKPEPAEQATASMDVKAGEAGPGAMEVDGVDVPSVVTVASEQVPVTEGGGAQPPPPPQGVAVADQTAQLVLQPPVEAELATTLPPAAAADPQQPAVGADTLQYAVGAGVQQQTAGSDTQQQPAVVVGAQQPTAGSDTQSAAASADKQQPATGADTQQESTAGGTPQAALVGGQSADTAAEGVQTIEPAAAAAAATPPAAGTPTAGEVKTEPGTEPDVVASPANTPNVPHLSGSQQVLAMSQKKLHRSQTAEQDAAAAALETTGVETVVPAAHPDHVAAGSLSLHHEHPETATKRPHISNAAKQGATAAAAATATQSTGTPGPSGVASKAGKAAGGAAAAAAAAGKDAGRAGTATPAAATAAGTGKSLKEPKPVQVQGDYAMGYHAKRHEFDPEYDNDAECIIADMEFTEQDTEEDKQLKLSILAIYNKRLDERERRRNFLRDYGLLSMRKVQALERRRSQAERETHARLRVFARYSTPAAHDELVEGLLLEQRLRARIQELKAYRQVGIRTFDEAEQFESEQRKKQKHGGGTPMFDGSWEGSNLNMSLAASTGAMLNLTQQQMAALSAAAAKDTGAASAATAPPVGGNKSAGPSLSAWRAHRGVPLDVTCLPGVEVLTARERELCSSARLLPVHYLALKDMMLRDCDKHGMMPRSEARTFFRLDQNRCLRLYDLWVSCGWITGDKATAQLTALKAAAALDEETAMQDIVAIKMEPEASVPAGTPSISYDQQPSTGQAAPQDDGRTPMDVS